MGAEVESGRKRQGAGRGWSGAKTADDEGGSGKGREEKNKRGGWARARVATGACSGAAPLCRSKSHLTQH